MLFRRAIAIGEKVLDPEHPNLATWCINLATLYTDQSKYAEAEPLFERAIAIREQKFGNEHPLTAAARVGYTAMLKKRKSQEPGS
jgi:tetratricopeptide (TPR) repeat protein